MSQVYYRGPNYFEVDIDIASSRAARSVVGLVAGTTKTVVVDMGILMEVQSCAVCFVPLRASFVSASASILQHHQVL